MRGFMRGGLAALAGVVWLAGCETTNVNKVSDELTKAVAPIEALQNPSWAEYQAALSGRAASIEKPAQTCAKDQRITQPPMRIACLEVQARANWWLAGLPEDQPMRGGQAASNTVAASREAAALCSDQPGMAQCPAIADFAATARGRAIAHRIEAGLASRAGLSPVEAAALLSGYAEEGEMNWAAGAGERLRQLIGHDACRISEASLRLRSDALSEAENLAIRDAGDAAAAAAARGMGLSLCRDGRLDCEEMAPCRPGGDAATCDRRYAAALGFACAPGGIAQKERGSQWAMTAFSASPRRR